MTDRILSEIPLVWKPRYQPSSTDKHPIVETAVTPLGEYTVLPFYKELEYSDEEYVDLSHCTPWWMVSYPTQFRGPLARKPPESDKVFETIHQAKYSCQEHFRDVVFSMIHWIELQPGPPPQTAAPSPKPSP